MPTNSDSGAEHSSPAPRHWGVLRLGREAATRARNQLVAAGFARRAQAGGPLPAGGVALFFGTGPDNGYQFEQWRRPLEQLARSHPVFVVVDRPDTGRLIMSSTTLPVAFARGSAALERLVDEQQVRVVLYVNQVEANFRMLRFTRPVHVQIGHGESDKDGSTSNQHKAYDLTFVGGQAGRDRLAVALHSFDAETRTVLVGRPQLDYHYPGAPDWPDGSGLRIWYAPTWEGDRPSIAYGSLASHGPRLIDALLANPAVRVMYRPHPRVGTASAGHAAADRAIRQRLRQAGDRHLIDDGDYGWQWGFADACITDVSAVAYDWLATRKPLLITEPVDSRAYVPPSPMLDRLRLLPASAAGQVLDRLGVSGGSVAPAPSIADLTHYYFGDVAGGASTRRFEAAITALLS